MPNSENDETLYIRCSDGRTRRPTNIRDQCVHQNRLPGGILDAAYMEKFFPEKLPEGVHDRMLMFRIATMVGLKGPKRIIVASHNHCGAGIALGMTAEEIRAEHRRWGYMIRREFPDIPVEVLHENHSQCGREHGGHEVEVLLASGM